MKSNETDFWSDMSYIPALIFFGGMILGEELNHSTSQFLHQQTGDQNAYFSSLFWGWDEVVTGNHIFVQHIFIIQELWDRLWAVLCLQEINKASEAPVGVWFDIEKMLMTFGRELKTGWSWGPWPFSSVPLPRKGTWDLELLMNDQATWISLRSFM